VPNLLRIGDSCESVRARCAYPQQFEGCSQCEHALRIIKGIEGCSRYGHPLTSVNVRDKRMSKIPQLPAGSPSQDCTPALVAAALAGGMIAAMAPMSPDEAVKLFGDVLAALSRAVEAEGTTT
jgi:hypothetical protein